MFWMHNISLQDHGAVSHINSSELISDAGFSVNQTSDGEHVTELSIAKLTGVS
jgi:hypothetical protein